MSDKQARWTPEELKAAQAAQNAEWIRRGQPHHQYADERGVYLPSQALNAAQMQTLQREYAQKLRAAIDDVELRKWAVESAIEMIEVGCQVPGYAADLNRLSREIYEFVSGGVKQEG